MLHVLWALVGTERMPAAHYCGAARTVTLAWLLHTAIGIALSPSVRPGLRVLVLFGLGCCGALDVGVFLLNHVHSQPVLVSWDTSGLRVFLEGVLHGRPQQWNISTWCR